ncbi:class I SAM-dependent methyltransferase [Campylobacter mucosalis]|uniref:class I SAM-dependent methyltransferase n=1 Tax=Campylobacter mucosalis TaxID=202 RepID=UPI00146FD394|nr:class I SAM-dependent methyltransferase [Campylobacter mucosalis]
MKLKEIVAKISQKIGLIFIGKFLEFNFYNKKRNTYLNERTIEYEFVLKNLCLHNCLDILDIGTGSNSFSSVLEHCGYNVTATDIKEGGGYWANFNNRHIYVIKDDITNSKIKSTFDAVLCISVLEHIPNFYDAVKGMVERLKDNGILIITFPYSHYQYCENIYKLKEADVISKSFRYIGQSFSRNEIDMFCKYFKLDVIDTQFAKGWSGAYWRTGERYDFPIKIENPIDANIGCFLFRKTKNK